MDRKEKLLIGVTKGRLISAVAIKGEHGNIELIRVLSTESDKENDRDFRRLLQMHPEISESFKRRSFEIVPKEFFRAVIENSRKKKCYKGEGASKNDLDRGSKEDKCSFELPEGQNETTKWVLKPYDIVTFDDNDKVVILATLRFKGRGYVFTQGVLPDETDVINGSYKIMVVNEDGTMQKESDPNILANIAPMFQKILEEGE